VEGHSQNLNKEVDGVASLVALRPAPVTFLDDQTGKGGQLEIARLHFDELEPALLQQGNQRDLAGRADLLAGPAGRWVRRGRGVTVFPPMRLNEDAIDLLEINDAGWSNGSPTDPFARSKGN